MNLISGRWIAPAAPNMEEPPPDIAAAADAAAAAAEDDGAAEDYPSGGNVGELVNHLETLKTAAVVQENYGEAERLKREAATLRRTSLSMLRQMHRRAEQGEEAAVQETGTVDVAPTEYDDATAAAWLEQHGFSPLDLHQAVRVGEKMVDPMMQAVRLGNLPMCRWLHASGAEALTTATNEEGNTPMLIASFCGHERIASWLSAEGGAKHHTTQANTTGSTPMHFACLGGHLEMCQWLFAMGASGDISKVDNNGVTPMLVASQKGYLHIMKWLHSSGAKSDVGRANHAGSTPLYIACSTFWYPGVWKFLVLNGALNRDGPHVLREVVQRDTPRLKPWAALGKETNQRRREMLQWAKGVLAVHNTWLYCFLMGTLPSTKLQTAGRHLRELRLLIEDGTIPDDAQEHLLQFSSTILRGRLEAKNGVANRSPGVSPLVWRLGILDDVTARSIKSLIADFVGVSRGRALRNAREFAETLVVVIAREAVTP
jgi:hypothetical protein